jgi:hypothetical protein
VGYPPSFDSIRQRLDIKEREGGILVMPFEKLRAVVRALLEMVEVDEAWYRRTYADVDAAMAAGNAGSAREHYIEFGYFEGRLPHDVAVDEAYYLAAYPDVAGGVENGGPPPKRHYVEHGYREGRSPMPPQRP